MMTTTTGQTMEVEGIEGGDAAIARRDAAAAVVRAALRAAGLAPRTLYVQHGALALSLPADEAATATQELARLGWDCDAAEPVTGRMVLITAEQRHTGQVAP